MKKMYIVSIIIAVIIGGVLFFCLRGNDKADSESVGVDTLQTETGSFKINRDAIKKLTVMNETNLDTIEISNPDTIGFLCEKLSSPYETQWFEMSTGAAYSVWIEYEDSTVKYTFINGRTIAAGEAAAPGIKITEMVDGVGYQKRFVSDGYAEAFKLISGLFE